MDIYNREITITLTGAQWFTLACVLQYAKYPKTLLSVSGRERLQEVRTAINQTLDSISKQAS